MSKTRSESIFIGTGIALLAYLIVEIIIEGIYGKLKQLMEFLKINPNAPNILQLYHDIQLGKASLGLIASIIFIIICWKWEDEINLWYLLGVPLGLLLYLVYITLAYAYLFLVP